MQCHKCGLGHLIDDSSIGIEVYRCWICGNRVYVGHPKRSGASVCSRCGNDRDDVNELGYCDDCPKFLNIHFNRMTRGIIASGKFPRHP